MALHKKHTAITREEHEALSADTYAAHSRHAKTAVGASGANENAGRAQNANEPATKRRESGAGNVHAKARAQARNAMQNPAQNAMDEGAALGRANAAELYASKRKARTRKTIFKRIGIVMGTLVCMLGLCAGALALYIHYIDNQITSKITDDLRAILTDTNNNEPFYALLLGIDRDEGRAESKMYGASDSAYRSDTIILTRIDPKNRKITMVSIPRDTYVDLGKHGKQKINAAYSVGGAAYATEVISKFAGVKISHYTEIDMDGFAHVVDSIGGVDVDLPIPVKDPNYTKVNLPAGKQHLDGHTAALLGRSRHAYDKYGDGDVYRAANQRMLIGAVLKKVLASGPAGIANSVTTMANYVTTDMSVSDIITLGTKFAGMDISNDIYSGLCPTTSKYINKTWFEILDTEKWRVMIDRVDKGLPPFDNDKENTATGIAGSVGISSSNDGTPADAGAGDAEKEQFEGTVAVLNAAGRAGVAREKSDILVKRGFSPNPGNARKQLAKSIVLYNEGAQAKARGVAKTLGITTKPQPNNGQYNSGTDVVVLVGKDVA